MLKHSSVMISSRESLEPEPLDLTLPKNERLMDEPPEDHAGLPSREDIGGQLLIKLLQQQILLSMLPRPEIVEEKRRFFCKPKERRTRSLRLEKVDVVVSVRRSEANARERNRVQHLADMFDRLRSVLPIEDDVKISKLATLKIASAYIRYLGCVLDTDDVRRIVECEQVLMLNICEAKIFPKKIISL